MKKQDHEETSHCISEAIGEVANGLVSDVEQDNAGDKGATVVDGLFAIARAVGRLAGAVERAHPYPVDLSVGKLIGDGLKAIASALPEADDGETARAIDGLANAIRDVNNPNYRNELAAQAFINHGKERG